MLELVTAVEEIVLKRQTFGFSSCFDIHGIWLLLASTIPPRLVRGGEVEVGNPTFGCRMTPKQCHPDDDCTVTLKGRRRLPLVHYLPSPLKLECTDYLNETCKGSTRATNGRGPLHLVPDLDA